ncbi:MAG: alginate export family protein [Pseudomonadota bacterium]
MRAMAIGAAAGLAATSAAAEPFRLGEALSAPDWLTVKGETRGRYESLDGQFRAGLDGSDQALLFRTLFQVEADAGPVAFGIELQDSRAYLDDAGTPLSSSFVNPLDFLQAYGRLDLPGLLGEGSSTDLTLGRQTVSIGSKRQIERVSFANVIKSFTGGHLESRSARGDELHVVLVVPVGRMPSDRASIGRNDLVFDREEFGRKIWAVHYRRRDILPRAAPGLWGEAFVYGLYETDTARVPTPNRRYATPGFRFFRARKRGQWDVDLEVAGRFGSRRETSDPADVDDLSVAAGNVHAAFGYTFDHPWRPRFSVDFDYSSGDQTPGDDRFDQYERLFGSRRTDLGNTSIHGPLTPANLSAPGFRVTAAPSSRLDGRIAYKAASLASRTDEFIIADLQDPAGESGKFLGHAIDGRVRYEIVEDSVELEIGASVFFYGGFTRNVSGGPPGDRTLFGFSSIKFDF